jgi:hypothetical protein
LYIKQLNRDIKLNIILNEWNIIKSLLFFISSFNKSISFYLFKNYEVNTYQLEYLYLYKLFNIIYL